MEVHMPRRQPEPEREQGTGEDQYEQDEYAEDADAGAEDTAKDTGQDTAEDQYEQEEYAEDAGEGEGAEAAAPTPAAVTRGELSVRSIPNAPGDVTVSVTAPRPAVKAVLEAVVRQL
jgi:hypothetical protein